MGLHWDRPPGATGRNAQIIPPTALDTEVEVMHRECEGKTNPKIAAILNITIHTASRHTSMSSPSSAPTT